MPSMSYEESSKQPFLNHDEDRPGSLDVSRRSVGTDRRKSRTRWFIVVLLTSHIPTIVALIFLLLKLSQRVHEQACAHPDLVPSPFRTSNALRYELRRWPVSFLASDYAGDPSPELDLAWHNLFEDVNIRVTEQDLAAVNLTSIPLAEGDYVAQLGVYHELHCIKKVRQWIFRDYYVPNISQEDHDEWAAHINHCIEMLRVSAMCRGDTSLSTFSWIKKGSRRYPTAVDTGPHQCVNWESLAGWVRERSVNISDPTTLLHPEDATD